MNGPQDEEKRSSNISSSGISDEEKKSSNSSSSSISGTWTDEEQRSSNSSMSSRFSENLEDEDKCREVSSSLPTAPPSYRVNGLGDSELMQGPRGHGGCSAGEMKWMVNPDTGTFSAHSKVVVRNSKQKQYEQKLVLPVELSVCGIQLQKNMIRQTIQYVKTGVPPHIPVPTSHTAFLLNNEKVTIHTGRYKSDFDELRIIGRGGFAKVMEVRHKVDQQTYAMKRVKIKSLEKLTLEKLSQEVTILAKLTQSPCPQIVRYHAAWLEEENRTRSGSGSGLHKTRQKDTPPPSSSESSSFTSGENLDNKINDDSTSFIGFEESRDTQKASSGSGLHKTGQKDTSPPSSSEGSSFTSGENLDNKINDDSTSFIGFEESRDTQKAGSGSGFHKTGQKDTPPPSSSKGSSFYTSEENLDNKINDDSTSFIGFEESRDTQKASNVETVSPTVTSQLSSKCRETVSKPAFYLYSKEEEIVTEGKYSSAEVEESSHKVVEHKETMIKEEIEEALSLRHPRRRHSSKPLTKYVLYIQMELCGTTLSTWLNNRNNDFQETDEINYHQNIHILRQILEGIHFVHQQDILHRDLKPQNVFLTEPQLDVKIGDFGLAREVICPEEDELDAVNPRSFGRQLSTDVGTSPYIAPEQEHGSDYDSKADMYSFGIIKYEMFHPFQTGHERVICIKKLREEGDIPEKLFQCWPEEANLIKLLTRKDKDLRPSASEILDGCVYCSKSEKTKAAFPKQLHQRDSFILEQGRELEDQSKQLALKNKELEILVSERDEERHAKEERDKMLKEQNKKLDDQSKQLALKNKELEKVVSERDEERRAKEEKEIILKEKNEKLRELEAKLHALEMRSPESS